MAKDEDGVLTTAFPFTLPLLPGEREVEDETFCDCASGTISFRELRERGCLFPEAFDIFPRSEAFLSLELLERSDLFMLERNKREDWYATKGRLRSSNMSWKKLPRAESSRAKLVTNNLITCKEGRSSHMRNQYVHLYQPLRHSVLSRNSLDSWVILL